MNASLLLRGAVVLSALTIASDVLACSVCFSAKNEASRIAFILTTVGLTVLPLLFIAWGVSWVVRREREQEASDNAARNAGSKQSIVQTQLGTTAS